MAIIKEDYLSFKTAKLLKEKGFLKEVDLRMTQNLSFYDNIGLRHNLDKYYDRLIQDKIDFVVAPTLQMAMKWLREVHLLHISADIVNGGSWVYYIYDISCPFDGGIILKAEGKDFKSYEDAIDSALLYALLNLF